MRLAQPLWELCLPIEVLGSEVITRQPTTRRFWARKRNDHAPRASGILATAIADNVGKFHDRIDDRLELYKAVGLTSALNDLCDISLGCMLSRRAGTNHLVAPIRIVSLGRLVRQ